MGIGIKDLDIENEINSISLRRGEAAGPLQVENRRLNHYQILLFVSRCTGQSETNSRMLGVVEEERQAHKVMPSKALLSTIVVSWGGRWFLTEYILNPSFEFGDKLGCDNSELVKMDTLQTKPFENASLFLNWLSGNY